MRDFAHRSSRHHVATPTPVPDWLQTRKHKHVQAAESCVLC